MAAIKKNNLQVDLQRLTIFRKHLHKHPELSGSEKKTAAEIKKFAHKFKPDKFITGLGGNGLAVIFSGKLPGPAVMLRADIDALPIHEVNNFDYKSVNSGVGHKCGHDGHTATALAVMELLSRNRPEKGKVVFLFQPAEETGQGALQVINDPKFKEIEPDYIFGYHNLPGYKRGSIILKEDTFASASKGMIIKLKGKTSHAAEPEKGNSPARAVSEIIDMLEELPVKKSFKDFVLVTVVHAVLGERAFGTTPGEAVVMATLRSYLNSDMEFLTKDAINFCKSICKAYKLTCSIEWTEEFSATVNKKDYVNLLKECAEENNLEYEYKKVPFRWSEDFGYFTERYNGAFFGIGSGVNHPQLHNPDYDFHDEIIPKGTRMFYSVIKKLTE